MQTFKLLISNVSKDNERKFVSICERYGFGGSVCKPSYGISEFSEVRALGQAGSDEDRALDSDLIMELLTNGFVISSIVLED